MRDLLIIGLRPNVSSSSGLDGVKRKFCKAPEIAKDRISLNFHIIKFANVKRYTFLKLQFLIVFCKTRLSHYNGCLATYKIFALSTIFPHHMTINRFGFC